MRWVPVYRCGSFEEASIVLGLLKSEGIPAQLGYEAWERVVGLQLSGVEVLVPEDQVEEALEILNDARDFQDSP